MPLKLKLVSSFGKVCRHKLSLLRDAGAQKVPVSCHLSLKDSFVLGPQASCAHTVAVGLSAAPGSHFFPVSNDEEKRIRFLLWPSHRGLSISSDGLRLTALGFLTPP